ncbi:hypothetical protein [Myxococcus sp. AM011]|uniref:hypothetical protein n=1 Tax=Myxococcus sp. AM011 TaxID=2745200 RepID=UPI0026E57139|nr:hypothetical protein [Myxococcus sp. AM011]
MTLKHTGKIALGMAVLLGVTGCRTPGAMGSGGMSASDGSSDGSGSGSDGSGSDGSSDGSGDSSNGSGDSSKSEAGSSGDSNHSSEEGGSSESRSSKQSDTGSSESESGGEGKDSRSETSNSENNDGRVVSATTVAATVIGLGVVIWRVVAAAERRRRAPPPPEEVGRAAQVYLRSRTHQLREDLALGAGPTVEDLASAASIRRENLGTFGRLLRANRQELLAMADTRTLTPERALAWLARVGELARADPRLDEDRRAFLAAHGDEEATAGVME